MLIKEKIVEIEDVNVTFFASNRSKSIRISIHPFKGVRVFVPLFVSFNSAKRFVKSKIKWIKKHVSKTDKLTSSMTVFEPGVLFNTKFHTVQFQLSSD